MERHEIVYALQKWLAERRQTLLAQGQITISEAAIIQILIDEVRIAAHTKAKLPWETNNAP